MDLGQRGAPRANGCWRENRLAASLRAVSGALPLLIAVLLAIALATLLSPRLRLPQPLALALAGRPACRPVMYATPRVATREGSCT